MEPNHNRSNQTSAAAAVVSAAATQEQQQQQQPLPPQPMQQQMNPAQAHLYYSMPGYPGYYSQPQYLNYPYQAMPGPYTPYRPMVSPASYASPQQAKANMSADTRSPNPGPKPQRKPLVIKNPATGEVIDLKTMKPAPASSAPSTKPSAEAAPAKPNPAAQVFAQRVSEAEARLTKTDEPATAPTSVDASDQLQSPGDSASPQEDSTTSTAPETAPAPSEEEDETSKSKAESTSTSDAAPEAEKSEGNVPDDASVEDNSNKENDNQADSGTKTPLSYEPGQYNPVSNRSGKRVYSKEFLGAICKLLGLENVLDEETKYESFNPISDQVDPFAPSFARGREHRPNHNYTGRNSAGPDKPRKIIVTTSYQQEVELKTTEKPWKPSTEAKQEPVDSEEAEVQLIKKKFRSILNKLTPNNFENLAKSVTDLEINTEAKLGEVIDIVFAKALAEPGYCVLYGQMCSHLKKITAGQANFGNTLLKRCQSQFQADIYSGLDLETRKSLIEKEENPDVKKQLNEELYEDMFRCRMRGLGLIKFIGELYKIEMLNDSIMLDCVGRLLQDTSEESIECLCDLLATIGEKLDNSCKARDAEKKKAPKQTKNAYSSGQKSVASVVASGGAPKSPEPSLDGVFTQLKKIREDESLPLSLRIRFKILDTIDLRERHRWSSKKKDNNPKKLEEIREAHMEQLEQEKKRQLVTGRKSQEGRRGGMGHASGSSSQISSMANESSGNRGGSYMHTSASSQALRDYPHSHANDTVDHQKKLENIKNLIPAFSLAKPKSSMDLRPSFQRPTSSGSSTTNTTSVTNKTS